MKPLAVMGPGRVMRIGRVVRNLTGVCLLTISAVVGAAEPFSVDHYVVHESGLDAIAGHQTALYVRERALPGTVARGGDLTGRVVLFVHGAGTPAEVAFDVPHSNYSWMGYLAAGGFDVFSMDVTGYGRSTRPGVMHDPCNLSADQAAELGLDDCEPGYGFELGNIASDWADIDAVVDYVTALRGVERVHLIGWSLGGPRAGGFAARNPDRVGRLVLLAPAYRRDMANDPPQAVPRPGASFTKQSVTDFFSNWDRQVGCAGQYDPAVGRVIWAEMLASDPLGATWGTGVRRAPRTTVWGFGAAAAAAIAAPVLIVQGAHDAQVLPDRARTLYQDLGSDDKVYIDLGCASHNAMWESVHTLMFAASAEWLLDGTVNGRRRGEIRMGYE